MEKWKIVSKELIDIYKTCLKTKDELIALQRERINELQYKHKSEGNSRIK